MNAVIVSIGTELTTGQWVDTNSAWIATELTRRGCCVVEHLTVDDDPERLEAAIRRNLVGIDMIVMTGGLGPTADDLTRDALARALGEPLVENAEAMEQVRSFFEHLGRSMHPANAVQGMIPRGCRVIQNHHGTAPGIWHGDEDVNLFALPGVPSEMKAMFTEAVAPHVERTCGAARTTETRLRCFGMSEARIGDLLADMMDRNRNPLVGTTAGRGIITIRILATGANELETDRALAADATEIRQRLGGVVFGSGDDSLESVVGRLLRETGQTVAVAESCTGGLLATRLTDVPGSSRYFVRGYVTYANEAKSELLGVAPELIEREGAVSEAVAAAMVSGCRTVSRSDYAMGVTGIAGPGGGLPPDKPVGLVYVALAAPGEDKVVVKRLLLGDHLARAEIRDRAVSAALNLLRLELLSLAAC